MFFSFFRQIRISYKLLGTSIIFAILASAFDGLSVLCLVPIIKGITSQNFEFVHNNAIFAFIPKDLSYFQLCSIFLFSILALASMNQLFRFLATFYMCKFARYIEHRLRSAIFSRYLSFSQNFFDNTNSGNLHSLTLHYTSKIADELSSLQYSIISIMIIIVYSTIMMSISWQLTIGIGIFSPLLLLFSRNPLQKIRKISQSHVAKSEKLGLQVSNVLNCIPLIKSCATVTQEHEKFVYLSEEAQKAKLEMDKRRCMVEPIGRFIMLVTLFIIIFIVIHLNLVSLSLLLVYFYMLREMLTRLNSFSLMKAQLATINGYLSAISQVLSDENKDFVYGGHLEFQGLQQKISFHNLRFSYGNELAVLKDICFEIPKNQTVAIVGSSGSGKTTIVKLLLRFYNCPYKTIFFDDIDICEFRIDSLMKHMSYVSQDTQLLNDTLRNNIKYGSPDVSDDELIQVMKQAKLYDLFINLPYGLDTTIGDNGEKLSGGEKQRVALARALIKNAPIWILDEATSALDSQTEHLLQSTIDSLQEKTIIIIAHRLSTIQNADKIVVLEDGMVVEQGTFADLLAKQASFYQYWNVQHLSY